MIISPGAFVILKFWFSDLKMTNISVYRTLYLRNHTSYDLHLWYTCTYERIKPSGVFSCFFKIWFSELLGWGKKQSRITRNSFCLTLHLSNYTSYDCDFWYTWVNWWYLQSSKIFHVLKFWFWGFLEGKSGKNKLPISVCFALYPRNCRLCYRDFDDDIYMHFSTSFI